MVTGIVIPAAGEKSLELREFATLEEYKVAVDGWIEPIDLHDLGVTIYVNEEGLLRQLPFNSRASFLRWYYVPTTRQRALLVGDAVIVGLPDGQGVNTDVPSAVLDMLLTSTRYYVELRLAGDPRWHRNMATYPDYWEAIVWAIVLLERSASAEEVRIVQAEVFRR